MEIITVILMAIGILLYIASIWHYKSALNPLGLFAIIWGTLPFVCSLQLMSSINAFYDETYIALFGSFFSFILGALLVTKRNYRPLNTINLEFTVTEETKIKRLYVIMLVVSIGEMFIKTPALLSDSPLSTYLEGAGVRFLHFAVTILPIVATLLLLVKKIALWKRMAILIPPLIIPLLWGQRGMAIGYVLGIMLVATILMPVRKQIIYCGIGLFLLLQMVIFVGDIRTNVASGGLTIKEISGISADVPDGLVWAYTYTVPAIANLDQTINNPKTPIYYGFDIIEPFLSLVQLKMFNEEVKKDFEQPFVIYDGFNVPTYLYWCYLNFGFAGFFIVPYFLGFILQLIYNKMSIGSNSSLALYIIFMPSLAYSFHDFLFWTPSSVLNVLIIFYIFTKLKVSTTTQSCVN